MFRNRIYSILTIFFIKSNELRLKIIFFSNSSDFQKRIGDSMQRKKACKREMHFQ